MPLLLIPEYSGINKGQRVPDRSKTAHWKPFVKWLPVVGGELERDSKYLTSRMGSVGAPAIKPGWSEPGCADDRPQIRSLQPEQSKRSREL